MLPLSIKHESNMQVAYIEKLKDDIRLFGPDQINMIKGYLNKTGIHPNIINIFEKIRSQLMTHYSSDLEEKYKSMKQQFITYLDHYPSSQADEKIDPWIELSQTTTNPKTKNKLKEISHFIQEILFECTLIGKCALKEEIPGALIDLEDLKTKLNRQFLNSLDSTLNKKDKQKLLSDLTSKIDEVETDLNAQKLEEACSIVEQIKLKLSQEASSLALKKS